MSRRSIVGHRVGQDYRPAARKRPRRRPLVAITLATLAALLAILAVQEHAWRVMERNATGHAPCTPVAAMFHMC